MALLRTRNRRPVVARRSTARPVVSLLVVAYLVIGAVVAWQRGYLNPSILRAFVSAVLAVLLWFLVLLGVDVHLH
jgi:hypothetical protein